MLSIHLHQYHGYASSKALASLYICTGSPGLLLLDDAVKSCMLAHICLNIYHAERRIYVYP